MDTSQNPLTQDHPPSQALTPDALREALEDCYPPDAFHWGEATQEVMDLSRHARQAAGLDETHAVDFYAIKTPSEYNTRGINSIIGFYEQMTEAQRVEYVRENQYLWTPEE